jgi:hypothetical protein
MKVTVGRVVLVKSVLFHGECPGIVTAVVDIAGLQYLNVHVFSNDTSHSELLVNVGPQLSDSRYGWRWPPGEAGSYFEHTPAIAAQEHFARV